MTGGLPQGKRLKEMKLRPTQPPPRARGISATYAKLDFKQAGSRPKFDRQNLLSPPRHMVSLRVDLLRAAGMPKQEAHETRPDLTSETRWHRMGRRGAEGNSVASVSAFCRADNMMRATDHDVRVKQGRSTWHIPRHSTMLGHARLYHCGIMTLTAPRRLFDISTLDNGSWNLQRRNSRCWCGEYGRQGGIGGLDTDPSPQLG